MNYDLLKNTYKKIIDFVFKMGNLSFYAKLAKTLGKIFIIFKEFKEAIKLFK